MRIEVKNAGLVLLSVYIPTLFERLALMENKIFRSVAAQQEAVKYLQYLATGLGNAENHLLGLNKVICGMDTELSVSTELTISADNSILIADVLQAAIGNWPAIGKISTDSFRGNWLERDGILTKMEDSWQLTVDKRAYDILIGELPFTFNVIKYPWMDKPLHVFWRY
jgi:hypothetical protein